MAEENVDVGLNNLGVSFTPEQEVEALRASLLYFLMFLDANGFGIARYPATPEEQVLFLQQPEAAIEDFATNFDRYVDYLSQSQVQPPSEQDIVDQIMKMLAAAGQEVSAEDSEAIVVEAEEVLKSE